MRHLLLFIISLPLLAVCAQGQVIPPTPIAPTAFPKVDIPRQLSLDRAQQILLQNNLTIIAARYGVDLARAQRLTASLSPNPTLTFGAEQFDVGHPFRDIVTTNPNTAAN